MKTFKTFVESIKHQSGSESTQVATTTGTYRKTAEKLHPDLKPNSDILDYGAGMGKGTDAMQHVLTGHKVESYEPSPKNWSPTHTNSDHIDKKYDAVVSHNVLNVLEPQLRDHVTKHLLSLVKPGGKVVVGARGYRGDVSTVKNFTPSEQEPNALWVHKKVGKVYQKGFYGDELLDHMKKHGGDDFDFKKVGGLAKSTVIGTRK
jgi:phospholipid N-methyltransferase